MHTDFFQDLQHHLYGLTLDQKLYLAPIKEDLQNVLDLGTGTGLWAIEFGSSVQPIRDKLDG